MRSRTGGIAALLALTAALAFTAAAMATTDRAAAPSAVGSADVASKASCGSPTIGVTGPFTGDAAFLGLDQRNWVRHFVSYWNTGKAIPGVPKGMKRPHLRMVDGDTRLDPNQAATVAQQMASNSSVLAIVGFSGSQENIAGGPILRRAGMAFVSGSATRVSLTDGTTLGRGFFFRTVPNDAVQGPTDVNFMLKKLGVKANNTVMIVDDAEAYSTALSDIMERMLKAKNVKVDRQSQPQSQKDFSSLAQRAKAEGAKVVVMPFQVAANAQLFSQQLRAAGYTGRVLGTDGVFDSTSFTFTGAYVSFFAPDVRSLPAVRSIVGSFKRKFGDTTPFGAPSWVAAQVLAVAISKSCRDGKISRAEVRSKIKSTNFPKSLIGRRIAFTRNGDVKGGSFPIYQIRAGGNYALVQP
jgi:branched-chain amino acid transport system substrate-binding protein